MGLVPIISALTGGIPKNALPPKRPGQTYYYVGGGDSLSAAYPHMPIRDKSFQRYAAIRMGGVTFLAAGSAGMTTTQMKGAYNQIVLQYKPSIVTVEGGVNDIINAGSSEATIVSNLQWMVNTLVDEGILAVYLPMVPFGYGDVDANNRKADSINATMTEWMKMTHPGHLTVNANQLLGIERPTGDPGNLWHFKPMYNFDTLHLTEIGYRDWGLFIGDAINKHFTGSPQITGNTVLVTGNGVMAGYGGAGVTAAHRITTEMCTLKGWTEINTAEQTMTLDDLLENLGAIPAYIAGTHRYYIYGLDLDDAGLMTSDPNTYYTKTLNFLDHLHMVKGWPKNRIVGICKTYVSDTTWADYGAGQTTAGYQNLGDAGISARLAYGVQSIDLFMKMKYNGVSGGIYNGAAGLDSNGRYPLDVVTPSYGAYCAGLLA